MPSWVGTREKEESFLGVGPKQEGCLGHKCGKVRELPERHDLAMTWPSQVVSELVLS